MTVSMVNVYCAVPWIDIFGSGLIGDEHLKLRKANGTYVTFLFTHISPYIIRISNFNPVFANDIYTIEYNGRDLFTTSLVCPTESLSGIYFIDSKKGGVRDTYNEVIKKIPDPTIRTAFIGE